MGNPQFTNDGLSIESFNDIYNRLVAGYQGIYGADIDTDPESPDGQRLAIITQLMLDLETCALQLYNQMDADLSSGEWLNKMIKYAGIFRQPATLSQVDVVITCSLICTLPAGYTVQDTLGQSWVLPNALTMAVGANDVTLDAASFGAFAADPDTVTLPQSVILGVTSVSNPGAAQVGQDEESDEALRIRRENSISNPAFSVVGGLLAKLLNLPNVTDGVVYENTADTTDVTRGMVSHSIWVVVEGGGVSDIVETMVKQRTAGCSTKGAQTGTYTETVTRPDGSTFIIVHDMTFDRPTYVPLYINLTATRTDPASPVDVTLMQNILATAKFHIGQGCLASQLYQLAYTTGNNFVLTALQISTDDVTFTDGEIIPALNGKFTLSTANIDITEVIP